MPLAELVTSLAARIERGESAVAWAAPCAQAIVFRDPASLWKTTQVREIRTAELPE